MTREQGSYCRTGSTYVRGTHARAHSCPLSTSTKISSCRVSVRPAELFLHRIGATVYLRVRARHTCAHTRTPGPSRTCGHGTRSLHTDDQEHGGGDKLRSRRTLSDLDKTLETSRVCLELTVCGLPRPVYCLHRTFLRPGTPRCRQPVASSPTGGADGRSRPFRDAMSSVVRTLTKGTGSRRPTTVLLNRVRFFCLLRSQSRSGRFRTRVPCSPQLCSA